MFQDFSPETQLVIIYNLLNPTLEALYKPLHLLKGITVTDEYWHDMMSVTSEGCDGKEPEAGAPASMPAPGPEPEVQRQPLPPKPRRVGGGSTTSRWSNLDPAGVVRDLVRSSRAHPALLYPPLPPVNGCSP
jgi:hypothetical protein